MARMHAVHGLCILTAFLSLGQIRHAKAATCPLVPAYGVYSNGPCRTKLTSRSQVNVEVQTIRGKPSVRRVILAPLWVSNQGDVNSREADVEAGQPLLLAMHAAAGSQGPAAAV